MATYKTPDVYVREVSVFPPSVAEVATAIPAFVGYTQKAKRHADGDLILKPTLIRSFKDFEALYGQANTPEVEVTITDTAGGGFEAAVTNPALTYLMYHSLKLFYNNGGGACYIVSVGTYQATPEILLERGVGPANGLKDGLDRLRLEDEPTLIVIPEAVKLTGADYSSLVQAVLDQCNDLKDRFGIFDLHEGGKSLNAAELLTNRGYFGAKDDLKYGAVYYPFTRTTFNYAVDSTESNVKVDYATATLTDAELGSLRTTQTALYNFIKTRLKQDHIVVPPSGAVAGVYADTDSRRGVWKAPANVGLTDVIEPVVYLDNSIQDDLNVDATTGKSINAIRAFAGQGTKVWGARTLAGNDNEWRYVPVRRFFNTVEESIKKSTYWAVFEPNDANTWVKVRGMIENYLNQKWREGALAGATPQDAFFVECGLGTTMIPQDILEGRMIVKIGMAVVRPAEFIILEFSHKLQTA